MMTNSMPSAPLDVVPTQVWAHIPPDLQQCTIRLLAHLALNWVVHHTTVFPRSQSTKEVPYDRP
jgi:hypothetical protein